jgi:hypothetical protein
MRGDCASLLIQFDPWGQTNMNQILVGPYGLHAFLGVALALFLGFLYVFNFTAFF